MVGTRPSSPPWASLRHTGWQVESLVRHAPVDGGWRNRVSDVGRYRTSERPLPDWKRPSLALPTSPRLLAGAFLGRTKDGDGEDARSVRRLRRDHQPERLFEDRQC